MVYELLAKRALPYSLSITYAAHMSWDEYVTAMVTVPGTPRWPQFRIEPRPLGVNIGEFPFDEAVVLVTAYNPGILVDAHRNACADARLLDAVLHRGLRWFRAVGSDGDRGGSVEPGFGIIGLALEEGVEFGAAFDQDAIYYWSAEALEIVSCRDDGKGERLGWELIVEPQPSVDHTD